MDQNLQGFVTNLYKFVSDLNRYYPTPGTSEFVKVFDKLDVGKLMLRFLTTMRPYEQMLKSRDETIFNSSLLLFPGIDISDAWSHLTSGQKNKIWTYLQLLFVQAELLLNSEESKEKDSEKNKTIHTMVDDINKGSEQNDKQEFDPFTTDGEKEFDPFVGVGDDNNDYCVTDVMESTKNIPDEPSSKPGLGSIANLVGIDKMVNLDELSDQLKNMSKDDIDDATNNIKGLLGNNVDENTSNLITNMLSNISEELKKDDVANGNPLDSIMKIAESVADKMRPALQKDGFNMEQLFNSTQNLAAQYKDDQGNPIFDENSNPMNMLNNMMNMMPNPEANPATNPTANPVANPVSDPAANPQSSPEANIEMNPDDMMKNYNMMMQNMGIDMSQIQNMFNNLNQPGQPGQPGQPNNQRNQRNNNQRRGGKKPKK